MTERQKRRIKNRRKQMIKKYTMIVAAALVIAAAALSVRFFTVDEVSAASSNSTDKEQTIADNVTIGGIDVSGDNASEAEAAIASYVAETGEREITLKSEDGEVKVKASDLGLSADADDAIKKALAYGRSGNLIQRFKDAKAIESGESKDFPMTLNVDADTTSKYLKDNQSSLVSEPVNASLIRENGQFTIKKGKEGHKIKIADSVAAIQNFAAEDFAEGSDEVSLVTKTLEPEGTEEELSQVTDVLGSFSTDFSSSSAARANNVTNGASKLNGITLYPGEQLSVADTLNPMTAENGYEQAPSYENGTTVLTYGGGICQVSTTLYNAVIRAELQVDERYAHSMPVHYVELSDDAAIAGDIKDFKFTNNQDYPIYIEGYTSGGVIYFNIWGKETRDADRTVDFESETVEEEDPEVKYTADPEAELGTITQVNAGSKGYVARLWKIVSENGKEVSREVFNNSTYIKSDTTYAVGTKSDDKDAVAKLEAAIATNDEDKITAAAAKAKAEASEKDSKKKDDDKKKSDDDSSKSDDKSSDSSKSDSSNSSSSKSDSSKSDD